MIHPPGNVAVPTEAWSKRVSKHIDDVVEDALEGIDLRGRLAPFYNPLREQPEAGSAPVEWSALSGTLSDLRDEQKWEVADRTRIAPESISGRDRFGQDEYCEWSVARNAAGQIEKVTFTSEVGEWYEHLAETDRAGLLSLYKDLVGPQVEEGHLFENGRYNPLNRWNVQTDGPIVHLAQENNNLVAAIRLAAEASVARARDGAFITDRETLMECNGLGAPDRFSDPSIATTLNAEAIQGNRISLANPPGLYLTGIAIEGMRLPATAADLDPADLWIPERGEDGRVVRARFEPPNGAFTLSEVLLDGKPIVSGAQLAARVGVSIAALVHSAGQEPVTRECPPPDTPRVGST